KISLPLRGKNDSITFLPLPAEPRPTMLLVSAKLSGSLGRKQPATSHSSSPKQLSFAVYRRKVFLCRCFSPSSAHSAQPCRHKRVLSHHRFVQPQTSHYRILRLPLSRL